MTATSTSVLRSMTSARKCVSTPALEYLLAVPLVSTAPFIFRAPLALWATGRASPRRRSASANTSGHTIQARQGYRSNRISGSSNADRRFLLGLCARAGSVRPHVVSRSNLQGTTGPQPRHPLHRWSCSCSGYRAARHACYVVVWHALPAVLQIRVWPGREPTMDLHIKHIEAEVPPWVLTAIGGRAHGRPPTAKPKLKADPSALPEQKRPR